MIEAVPPPPAMSSLLLYLIVCSTALVAAGLTFFSGFGLGTLLLPALSFFFPVEQAVGMTAVVHLANGLFKLVLVGRHIDRGVLLRFGLPAIAAAFAGATLLVRLADVPPLAGYDLLGRTATVTPVKLTIGLLLAVFAGIDLVPAFGRLAFPPAMMPVGGVLSGFFGGLSGMQGALRAAFLSRAGLSKEAYVATAAAIGCLVDFTRLGRYAPAVAEEWGSLDLGLLAAVIGAAFAGSSLGSRFLRKVTIEGIRRLVAAMLLVVAVGLAAGLL